MFEKSESDKSLLFTVAQAIFLLTDASLESGCLLYTSDAADERIV